MICKNCGHEIEDGRIYCDFCGESVQIVPDYNILDEDILPEIVEDPKLKKERKDKENLKKKKEKDQEKKEEKGKKKINKRLMILLSILMLLLLIEGIIFFIGLYRTSYSYYMKKADEAVSDEELDTAVYYYDLAAKKDKDSGDALLLKALNLYKLKDYEAAEEIYLSYINENPDDISGYKGLLNIYGALNDHEKIKGLRDSAPDSVLSVFSDFVLSTVSFKIPGGEFSDDVMILLSSDEDIPIYYTLDGSDPDLENATLYTAPFILYDGKTVIKACNIDDKGHKGRITEEIYEITYKQPERPYVSPGSGIYDTPTYINMSAGEDCEIYYTWDNTMPGKDKLKYREPIMIPEGNNILSVIAIDKHGLSSSVLKLNYEYLP